MTLLSRATLEPSAAAGAALEVLARAAGKRALDAKDRIVATPDRFNPDEGLALLDAYVEIADVAIRQAVLDIILTIAGTAPYRRARTIEAPSCGCASRKAR